MIWVGLGVAFAAFGGVLLALEVLAWHARRREPREHQGFPYGRAGGWER